MGNVRITLTDEQLRLVMRACEEYFRLRLNQWRDFADDVCAEGVDFSQKSENHAAVFDNFIARRNTMQSTFTAIFRELTVITSMRPRDCIDLIDIWETIRHWLWEQKPAEERKDWTVDSRPPLNEGQYPLPKIERVE